ncbi:retropepsin-like aspartic peptidase RloA3 [Halopseudomonas maritima]|uniref:retropepsin-like aspartic peptidase RloA3 n=1 Tax=Halopseudomonas maritima TaxID=2918528 RepID=UPI001EEC05E5|nr:ATP-dependent zinc protease [Halopseudomonas maritima]UJJ31402.1 ATP-dependent zinc protease [Halopseudomonas maritima]
MQSFFKVVGLCSALLGTVTLSTLAQADGAPAPRVVGWIEKGLILPEYTAVKIKVDSGALTSSMHAVNLEEFEYKGNDWVRYDVPVEDVDTGEEITMHFERPVYRRILVRGAGGSERRPVVKMSICMGDQVYEEQFSLRDRGDMNYPVLIGRRTIEHIGLIDVSETFMHKPSCSEAQHDQERRRQQQRERDGAGNDAAEAAEESDA